MSRTLLCLGLVFFCLLGCSGANMVAYAPVHEKTDRSPRALFEAAVATLEDMGYNLATNDPSSFRLTTKQRTRNVSEILHEKYRYAWTVSTAGGSVSIELSCSKNSGTSATEFKDCGKQAPRHLVHEQQRILKGILAGGGS